MQDVQTVEHGEILIPDLLGNYMDNTDQYSHEPFTMAHLLHEGEWVLWNMENNKGSSAYEGTQKEQNEMRVFVHQLQKQGIKPKRDWWD